MKSRIKNKEECTKILEIEISKDAVKRITEEVYAEIKKVTKIPGFRPGTAPQDLLEKHYSKDAKEEVLKRLIPEGYKHALESHKIVPVSLPRIYNVNFETDKPLTFEAQVDVRPNIKLKNYRGIRVKRKKVSVSKEEMDDTLLRLRSVRAKYNDVARPVKKGDYAVCDVEVFVEGKAITKQNKNMWILADKDVSLLGMGEELIGLAKGHTKEIDTKLPENYPDKKFAGKQARFKVLVNEVKEKELPELNDEFAKGMNSGSMEELKNELESQLFARKENDLRIDMENQILDRLLKDYRFSAPPTMLERQKEVMAKRFLVELTRKGSPKEEAEKKVKELDSKIRENASNKVKIYFILDSIALKEKISVSKEDIEERFKAIAASTGQPEEEVKKYYEKENLIEGLSEEIKEMKVLEFLLKQAEITEVQS